MRSLWWALVAVCGCPVSLESETPSATETMASASEAPPDPSQPRASPAEPQGAAPSPQGGANPDSADAPSASSVPIRIDVAPPSEDAPRASQDELRTQAHVTYTGTVRCDGCADPLVLRVVSFQDPTTSLAGPAGPLTVLPMSRPGPFRLLVPRTGQPVVLELLVDGDGNGAPSRGERMAVIVEDGKLIPTEDRQDLVFDASEMLTDPMLVGPGGDRR